MFYAVCGALKNRDRIQPKLTNSEIKSAMKHPLQFGDILTFRKYRFLNIGLFLLGLLPANLTVFIIKLVGKKKNYI